jgi:Tripartite tricarboxylate transporter TctB family
MKSLDIASSIVLLLFSLLFWCQVLTLPIGQATQPDTGLWPLVLAVLVSVASLVFFMKALKARDENRQKFFSRAGSWKQVALSIVILVAFASLFLRLGYLLSTFGLIAIFLRMLNSQKWWIVFTTACLTAGLSYLLFGWALGIELPKGPLGI